MKNHKFTNMLEIKKTFFPDDKINTVLDEKTFGRKLANKSLEKIKSKISEL